MSDMEMYKEQILDLYKHPINVGPLTGATHSGHKHNPSCGDEFTVELLVRDGKVVDARFTGSGCAISTASVCLLTEALKGKSIEEAARLTSDDLIAMLGIPVSASRMTCLTLGLECARIALSSHVH